MENHVATVSIMKPSLSSTQLNYPSLIVPEKSQKLPMQKCLSLNKEYTRKEEISRQPNNLRWCTQLMNPLKHDASRTKVLEEMLYKKPKGMMVKSSPKKQERQKNFSEKRVHSSKQPQPYKIPITPILSESKGVQTPTKEIKLPNRSSPETTKTASRAPVKEPNSISPKTPKQIVPKQNVPKRPSPIIYDISREQSPIDDSKENSIEEQLMIEANSTFNPNENSSDESYHSLELLISPYDENRKRIEQFKAQLRATLSSNDMRSELRAIHDIIRIP
jgi:hypothetical protein